MRMTGLVACLLAAACSSVAEGQRSSRSLEYHAGLRFGIPHAAAVYAGTTTAASVPATYDYAGPALTAVVGLGGAQIGFGRGQMGHIGGGRIQAAVLRTWGNPLVADANQTYVGAEAQLIMGLGAALGAYLRVEGRAGGNRAFIAASLLLGV